MKFMLTVSRFSGLVSGQTNLGLNALDIARQESGLPDLPAEVVNDYASGQHNAYFEIDEDLARRSGRFDNTAKLHVKAESLPLTLKCRVNRKDDGQVTLVQFNMCLDESAFLRQWEDAGFPLEMTE